MSNYSKGAKFENDVIKFLRKKGLLCLRSGASRTLVDVIGINRYNEHTFVYLIQCKYGKAKMIKKDKQDLKNLAEKYGCIPVCITKKKYKKDWIWEMLGE